MDIVEQFAVVILGEREEYQVTLQLVRHFLPGLTDEEYIIILAQREQRHDPMPLGVAGGVGCLRPGRPLLLGEMEGDAKKEG